MYQVGVEEVFESMKTFEVFPFLFMNVHLRN